MTNAEKAEVIAFRLGRAKKTLEEVEFLIQNGFMNTAVNRLYYACFFAVGALFVKENIHAHTHKGTIQMFGSTS